MNFRSLIISAVLAAAPITASAEVGGRAAPSATAPAGSYQVAQACGWYAISVCSRSRGAARRAANTHGGYVIDSGSDEFPNFRPGWWCAVNGPMSRRRALRRADDMRYEGARSAYAKSAC